MGILTETLFVREPETRYRKEDAQSLPRRVYYTAAMSRTRARMLAVLLFVLAAAPIIVLSNFSEVGHGDCTCPGYAIKYKCTVVGGAYTLWRGSTFDCSLQQNEILLSHTTSTSQTCNDGAIIGSNLEALNGAFTSLLIITNVSLEMNGKTVECAVLNASGTQTFTAGTSIIRITRAPSPPPEVQLIDVRPGMLTFRWNLAYTCAAIHYRIESDCGSCVNISYTTLTTISCSIEVSTSAHMCTFAVRSIVCGNISSELSNHIEVVLKVPESPQITSVITVYLQGRLTAAELKFNHTDPFMISDTINSSVIYTASTYTDSTTNRTCHSNRFSCIINPCVLSIPLQCYQSSGDIMVSLSPTNQLGSGPITMITIGGANKFVEAKFVSTNRVLCTFLDQRDSSSTRSYICKIKYGHCESMTTDSEGYTVANLSRTVRIDLPSDLQDFDCYTITGSNGTFTVLLKGLFRNHYQQDTDVKTIIMAIIIAILLVVVLAVSLLVLLMGLKLLWSSFQCQKKSGQKLYSYVQCRDNVVDLCLQDKPWQLKEALKVFKDRNLDITDTKITNSTQWGHKNVIIKCGNNLSAEDMQCIQQHILSTISAISESDDNLSTNPSRQEYVYPRTLPPQPGSLLQLLDYLHLLAQRDAEYNSLNITGIDVSSHKDSENKTVTLHFVCEGYLPPNWKDVFDQCETNL